MRNQELARAWAGQYANRAGQVHHKASHFWYEGADLYSYRTRVARLTCYVDPQGHRVAFITNRWYSRTTQRHLQLARVALLQQGMRFVLVSDVAACNLAQVHGDLDGLTKETARFVKQAEATRVGRVREARLRQAKESYKQATLLLSLFVKDAAALPAFNLYAPVRSVELLQAVLSFPIETLETQPTYHQFRFSEGGRELVPQDGNGGTMPVRRFSTLWPKLVTLAQTLRDSGKPALTADEVKRALWFADQPFRQIDTLGVQFGKYRLAFPHLDSLAYLLQLPGKLET